jgi:hypothetical protein
MSRHVLVGRFALTLVAAVTSLHCGGEQFSAAPSADGAGNQGASGQEPPLASAGEAPGGGTGNDVGPQGGRPGSGAAGSGAGDPSGDAGQPGAAGNDGAGGSGSDDPIDEEITLELTPCGANAFGTGIEPTLYSTLDSELAITQPEVGELGFVGNAVDDYHGDLCGTSINIDQSGDYVKYHYQDNGVQHFSPLVGALDFWYRPTFEHTDGLNHHLFSTANWQTAGGFRIRKAASNNANALQVIVGSAALQTLELSVAADDYALSPGVWARVTMVWYLGPELERRYVRLFVDGKLKGELEAPATFQMAPDVNGYFVFGVWDFADPEHASGLLDDLKVFNRGP